MRIPVGIDDGGCPDGGLSSDEESDEVEEDETGFSAPHVAHREQMREQRRRKRDERNRKREETRNKMRARKREMALEQVDRSYISAHMIQIVIHCNHQNGRDSHVRMVKVLGTEKQVARVSSKFSSKEFQMYESIR